MRSNSWKVGDPVLGSFSLQSFGRLLNPSISGVGAQDCDKLGVLHQEMHLV